ncbi:hypothetical protein [Nitrosomonas ureae]|uniref:hypothetical protein n=1 Tax=Nitrosomonas ureae TaxID=44577 RepID=UPI001552E24C|nr:hypothetical protein [Nitrosomonas ureae]
MRTSIDSATLTGRFPWSMLWACDGCYFDALIGGRHMGESVAGLPSEKRLRW